MDAYFKEFRQIMPGDTENVLPMTRYRGPSAREEDTEHCKTEKRALRKQE
jgi:hypothetical protein